MFSQKKSNEKKKKKKSVLSTVVQNVEEKCVLTIPRRIYSSRQKQV